MHRGAGTYRHSFFHFSSCYAVFLFILFSYNSYCILFCKWYGYMMVCRRLRRRPSLIQTTLLFLYILFHGLCLYILLHDGLVQAAAEAVSDSDDSDDTAEVKRKKKKEAEVMLYSVMSDDSDTDAEDEAYVCGFFFSSSSFSCSSPASC